MTSIPQHYLLIDDSATDRFLAQEAFAQVQPECTLTCVSSGAEALELLESGFCLPDVILLDINMPGLTGFQVLERLKNRPELQGIPVVMLSTSSAQQDVREAYSLHASSYLVKSARFDDFVAQIEMFLEYWRAIRGACPHGHQNA